MMKCGKKCKAKSNITNNKWIKIKNKCEEWQGLDKFSDIFETVPWENGHAGYKVCSSCFISLCSSEHLAQAQARKQKYMSGKCDAMTEVVENTPQVRSPSPKRLRSSLGVLYYPKTHCVWCMEGIDNRHPERKKGNLCRIETNQGWRAFKRHTVLIKDSKLRERIERVAESTSQLSDPFAADIVYHYSCWMDYITNPLQLPTAGHFENVTQFEMKNLFLRYVDQIIFSDHEIRTTQSLLLEYKRLASEYGFVSGEVRGSYIKDMLIQEYGDLIGFRELKEKNKSELVFDRTGGGDYVDMAVNSLEFIIFNFSSLYHHH